MTQDDVIRITRSLGICELTSKPKQSIHYSLTIHEMLNVFKLVAEHERKEFAVHAVDIARRAVAEEREACAKVCDDWDTDEAFVANIAEVIRARGQA